MAERGIIQKKKDRVNRGRPGIEKDNPIISTE